MNLSNSFTQSYNGIKRELLTIVTLSHNENSIDVIAKWDTGAATTCIAPRIADILNLEPCGQTNINTSVASALTNNYKITITLPQKYMKFENMFVWSMKNDRPDYDILIGMDIISQGDFCVSNYNNETVMSFRIPSLCKTDYVEEFEQSIQSPRRL